MACFTSIVTKVLASAENIQLIGVGDSRYMLTIYNHSTAALYIKYGISASLDSFTIKISAGDYLELPFPCYTGQVDGFWEVANGCAMITEINN